MVKKLPYTYLHRICVVRSSCCSQWKFWGEFLGIPLKGENHLIINLTGFDGPIQNNLHVICPVGMTCNPLTVELHTLTR